MNIMHLAIYLLLFSTSLYAQPQTFKFDYINSSHGLAHNSVLSILKDSKGFMWFGTYGGLNKYDGYNIRTFSHEYGNKNSISENPIVAIYEDLEGVLWLGTRGGGVIQYDPKTDIFKTDKYLYLDPKRNITPNVKSIFEDIDGSIWLASSEGLVQFDKVKNVYIPYRFDSNLREDNDLTIIHEGPTGKFWIGSYLGLKLFDRDTRKFTSYKPNSNKINSLGHPSVISIYEDKVGILWIGTEGGGLDKFNTATEQFTHFKHDVKNPNSLINNYVFDVKEFEPGKLWIATELGISILDTKTERFEHILPDPHDLTSLSYNVVRCMYKDHSEVIWLGTDGGGVNKMDSRKKKFNILQKEINNTSSLSSNNVFALNEDVIGNIWIGTIEGGLNRLDPQSKKCFRYTPDPKDRHAMNSHKILSLHSGNSKNLWIGTDRGGLWMLPEKFIRDPKLKAQFISFYKDTIPNTINSNVIFSVLEDHTGTLWAGTWGSGLNKMNFNKKLNNGETDYNHPTVTHYLPDNANPTALSHEVVFTMYEDRQGTLWIGTAGGGLDKHEKKKEVVHGQTIETDIFIHYKNNPEDFTSLSNNHISGIYESHKGDFWIGTSIGLNKMDRKTGKCKVYTVKDGLPNNAIFGIVEDDKENLWISTQGGISKFNPVAETFRNYTRDDGLQDNVFNPEAFCLSHTGKIYYGGTNGVTSFFPDSIADNPYKPEVMLTDFKLFNKPVPIGVHKDEPFRLARSISTVDEIYLSYKDYVFSIEFSGSNYSIPEKNQFAYMMEGFDKDWVYTDAKNRTATYTNLDPGKYIFRVKASNCDGVWSDEVKSITLNISPPFWKTVWFKLLQVVIVLGLLYLIYRIRVRIIKQQKRVLEKQVNQRTKEILSQKKEIESQKENIEEKNVILEKQYNEITVKNSQIVTQNKKIEEATREINDKNEKLERYNATLEKNVKERTEQLTNTYASLDQTNKELDQFIYRSAHDLKGPIATITGLCYLGSLESNDPKILEILKRMDSTTEEMNDKLSRLMRIHEFNTMDLKITNVDYNALLQDIIDELKNENDAKHVKFKWLVQAGSYKSDIYLIRKLLTNLIENAIMYQDEEKENRHVHIEVKREDNRTKISICDNGIGIPKNQAPRVFDLFVVATEEIKGFGLGLYEAKLIARRLNGVIKLLYPESGDTEFDIIL